MSEKRLGICTCMHACIHTYMDIDRQIVFASIERAVLTHMTWERERENGNAGGAASDRSVTPLQTTWSESMCVCEREIQRGWQHSYIELPPMGETPHHIPNQETNFGSAPSHTQRSLHQYFLCSFTLLSHHPKVFVHCHQIQNWNWSKQKKTLFHISYQR